MHHFWTAAIAILASVLASWAQQTTDDPTLVFLQTQQRLLADLSRLSRYTCVQAITRNYFGPQPRPWNPRCAKLIAAHDARTQELPLEASDRLRLEVAIIERGNIYSWLGAPKFDEDAVEVLAGSGPLGSGDFGVFLKEIFRRATVKFQRSEAMEGRRLFEYSYDMPIGESNYDVKTETGWIPTAYSGTFRLDADSTDIVSLTVRTAEMPRGTQGCQARSEIEYGRTLIHDRMILIPRETRLRTINRDGSETLSVTQYASCREYASRSRMLLEARPSRAGTSDPVKQSPPNQLPAGLRFSTRIVTPIDSDTAWGGDPIEAMLRLPMRDKKHNVVAPAGAVLHGRLVLVERGFESAHRFRIGVQFESIEINGQTVFLRAAPYLADPFSAQILGASGVFTFYTEHLQLDHFDSAWITITPSGEGSADIPDNR